MSCLLLRGFALILCVSCSRIAYKNKYAESGVLDRPRLGASHAIRMATRPRPRPRPRAYGHTSYRPTQGHGHTAYGQTSYTNGHGPSMPTSNQHPAGYGNVDTHGVPNMPPQVGNMGSYMPPPAQVGAMHPMGSTQHGHPMHGGQAMHHNGAPYMPQQVQYSSAPSYQPQHQYGQPAQHQYGQPAQHQYGQPQHHMASQPAHQYGQPAQHQYGQHQYGQPQHQYGHPHGGQVDYSGVPNYPQQVGSMP